MLKMKERRTLLCGCVIEHGYDNKHRPIIKVIKPCPSRYEAKKVSKKCQKD